MTTQACNLPDRIPAGPMLVQRADKSSYVESDEAAIARMIKAEIVEGIGPPSGRIRILRITCSEDEALKRLQAVFEPSHEENPGSITSMASREIYREKVNEEGLWTWNFKQNRTVFA